MRFLLLLWGDEAAETALPDEEQRAIVDAHAALSRALQERGAIRAGEALAPSSAGAVVRPAEGLVTDGPFVETKEQLGGFYVLECADRDEAVAWARQIPRSPGLVVEVRPILQL